MRGMATFSPPRRCRGDPISTERVHQAHDAEVGPEPLFRGRPGPAPLSPVLPLALNGICNVTRASAVSKLPLWYASAAARLSPQSPRSHYGPESAMRAFRRRFGLPLTEFGTAIKRSGFWCGQPQLILLEMLASFGN